MPAPPVSATPPGGAAGAPPSVAIWAAAIVGPLLVLSSIPTFGPSAYTAHFVVGVALLGSGVGALLLGLAVAGALTILWLRQVRAVTGGRDRDRHRLSMGLAAGSWFIPVGNLWLPAFAVIDVVRAVDPALRAGNGHRSLLERQVWLWWGAWLASGMTFWLGFIVLVAPSQPSPFSSTGLTAFQVLLALSMLALIAAGAVFNGVLRVIAHWLGQSTVTESAGPSAAVGDDQPARTPVGPPGHLIPRRLRRPTARRGATGRARRPDSRGPW
jgi:hypothetical protein